MAGPGRTLGLARFVLEQSGSGIERAGHAEPVVVVPVRGIVPVAVRRAEVLWVVVPRAAAKDAQRGVPIQCRLTLISIKSLGTKRASQAKVGCRN